MRQYCLMDTIRPSAKEAIIEAAFQLYNEDPTASLADIAVRAGISRATLHRHFSGRDELLLELAKAAIHELDTVADQAAVNAQSYTEALQLIMHAIVPLANRQWFLSREVVQDHEEIVAEYQRQADEMHKAIDEAKKEGSFSTALSTVWIAQVYDNLIFAAWEMVRLGEATPKQASDLAWQTFINGVADE